MRIAHIAWLGLLALGGCGGGFSLGGLLPDTGADGERKVTSSTVPAIWRENTNITVRGDLAGVTGDSRQCLKLQVSETESFALIGDAGRFREGDRVQVSGPIAQWSTCETYKVVRIDRIAPAAP